MLGETVSSAVLMPTFPPYSLSSQVWEGSPGSGPRAHGRSRDSSPILSTDTPRNVRGGKRSFTVLTKQEKDYKRPRVLIRDRWSRVTDTGVVRGSLRHKDRPMPGQTVVARDRQ